MRFQEQLHWSEGLFLQPHHLQFNDRLKAENDRIGRSLFFAHPWGLIDFELDMEALKASSVAIRRFSAIMNSGLEVSYPGNCVLKPLDLAPALKQNPGHLIVYIAVPNWSEFESNVTNGSPESNEGRYEKKIYITASQNRRDENDGNNEIPIVTRRINARLLTNLDDTNDMDLLPVLHLNIVMSEGTSAKVTADHHFIPPFLILSDDNPVVNLCSALTADIRRCRDKMLNILTATAFRPEDFSGAGAHTLLVYKTLNLYETNLSSMLSANTAVFSVYRELLSFLSELMGLYPIHSIRELPKYDHANSYASFSEVLAYIRSFLQAGGGAAYMRHPFKETDPACENFLSAVFSKSELAKLDEVYIAVQSSANEIDIINFIEGGDKFKITGPISKTQRTRGIKLISVRYPPRVLPVITGAIWFKLDIEGNAKIWDEIINGGTAVIDYVKDLFPALETSLFTTINEDNK